MDEKFWCKNTKIKIEKGKEIKIIPIEKHLCKNNHTLPNSGRNTYNMVGVNKFEVNGAASNFF